jgi:hypothetical protein
MLNQFDATMHDICLTDSDTLLEYAKRDQQGFLLLLTKVLEVAVQHGVTEADLHVQVSNAAYNVPLLGKPRR